MALYEYESLDLERRSFRLIRLLKADCGSIQCELFHAWLDGVEDALEYEALSYTWGNGKELYEIEANGRRLEVTGNLFQALQHLRYQHEDRVIWIDALCIDQSNLEERGHQVRQMSSIYAGAENVIVWLGSATSDTDVFFQHMQVLEKEAIGHACANWKSSDERWQSLWSNVRLQWNDFHEDEQREGLKTLLRRSWFRRVWILQEVANARSARIMCGAKSIPARIFGVAPTLLGIMPDPHCQAVFDIMPGSFRQYSWWAGNRDLRTLLTKFKKCEATDPRDIVYALLGISSDGCRTALLVPDYTKSLEHVIQDTVTFLLRLHDWKKWPPPSS
ncbi:heterokaryon incompatibility protein-domain-containing protein [Paraphoma chrysanthemicola]|uniref:Heterokaryon incompatibility protein-domain-containing protein n=1 Tax=Paraphoma chrysanthemicola TaxID=798071 RepID=A0A8K0VUF1_9PLEO|nr:heterokaryon incompatibility protein-domain-containing protein [Paraphoma chrysanthemicola]